VARRIFAWVCAAAVGSAAAGCRRGGEPAPTGAEERAGAGQAAPSGLASEREVSQPPGSASAARARGDRPARAAAAPIEQAKVRALLDAWQQAQNDGDFERYRQLYAERMVGIKRVGERTYEYGHDRSRPMGSDRTPRRDLRPDFEHDR
jgi:hypothetical protein